MKKITCFALLLIVSSQLFSQDLPPITDTVIKTDYLKKSKNQRTAGTICTVTGAALMGVGFMILIGNATEDIAIGTSNVIGAFFLEEPITPSKHSSAGTIITITGTAILVTGISLLGSAKKNKHKAFAFMIKNEQTSRLQTNMLVSTMVPSIGLRWQL